MLDHNTSQHEGKQTLTRFPEIKYPSVKSPNHMTSILKFMRTEPPFIYAGCNDTFDPPINELIEEVKSGKTSQIQKNFDHTHPSLIHIFPGSKPHLTGPVNVMVYKPEGASDDYRVLIQGAGGRHLEVGYGSLGGKTQVKYMHLQDASESLPNSDDPTTRVVSDTTIRYYDATSEKALETNLPRISIVQNRHISTDSNSIDISYEQGPHDEDIKVVSASREVHKGNHKERFTPLILPSIHEDENTMVKTPSWVRDAAHKLPPDNTHDLRAYETIFMFPQMPQKVESK